MKTTPLLKKSRRNAKNGGIEILEARIAPATLIAPTTDVGLGNGNLTITDSNGGTSDDSLTLKIVGDYLRISDPNNLLVAGDGTTLVDGHTVDVFAHLDHRRPDHQHPGR